MSSAFQHSKKDRKALLALAFFIASFALMTSIRLKQDNPEIVFSPPTENKVEVQRINSITEPSVTSLNIDAGKKSVQPVAMITSDLPDLSHQDEIDRKERFTAQKDKKSKTANYSQKPLKNTFEAGKHKRFTQELDVNASDVIDWEALPGIGPYYAKLITNFRDKLGGFTSIEQVGETWRLPDSTFQMIKPRLAVSPVYRKIDINTASEELLKEHPYINWKQAVVIINYRIEHGPITSIDELSKIYALKAEWIQRIEPYLIFQLPHPNVDLQDSL